MTPTITAFAQSPDGGRGLARDMPVRWALEEAGQAYRVRFLSFPALKEPAHRALQPFGQIPTYQEGDLTLFESGAIVLHIAGRPGHLLPVEPNARARAVAWLFAALNTVEPPVFDRSLLQVFEREQPWYVQRLQMVDARIHARLDALAERLGPADWLDGAFSAGDLMMVAVLRRLHASGILNAYPTLAAYVARGEARPAFRRAFDAQRAAFDAATRESTAPPPA